MEHLGLVMGARPTSDFLPVPAPRSSPAAVFVAAAPSRISATLPPGACAKEAAPHLRGFCCWNSNICAYLPAGNLT